MFLNLEFFYKNWEEWHKLWQLFSSANLNPAIHFIRKISQANSAYLQAIAQTFLICFAHPKQYLKLTMGAKLDLYSL